MKKHSLKFLFTLALCIAVVLSLASCDLAVGQKALDGLKAEYEAQIADQETKIDQLESKIDELEDQKATYLDEIEKLEAKITELEDKQNPPSGSTTYTVTFDTVGGSAVAAQTVACGEKISVPTDPEKAGYIFDGWYAGEEKWSFVGYVVTENVLLTARWIPRSYSITYVTNGGNNVTQNINNFNITQLPLTFTPGDTHKNDHRFDGWYADAELTIPFTSITKIGDTTIYAKFTEGTPGLEYTNNVIYCSVSGYTGDSTTVIIPDYHNDNPIKEIDKRAFISCSNLVSITMPDSITSIDDEAFGFCTNLTSITIPSGVTSIGYGAFADCSSLTNITTDKNNAIYTSIDGNLYTKDGETLVIYAIGKTDTSFVIPNDITSIGAFAFYSASNLTNIIISDSVTHIENYAFHGCRGLTSIIIPENVTYIGDHAFAYCGGLVSVTIPDSVTSIGSRAFEGCSSLTSVTIPDSVTSIGSYAFSGCGGLTIYAEASAKHSGWDSDWNSSSRPVVWGYKAN